VNNGLYVIYHKMSMFNFSDDLNLQYLLLNLQLSGSYWFLMKVNAFHPGGALFETL
jgi:hypothetical protein